MSDEEAVVSNAAHLSAFLDKIAADREQALAAIDEQLRQALRALRREAQEAARAFHREQAERTRRHCRQQREHQLAQARGRLRRQQWQALEDLAGRLVSAVADRMQQAWCDPRRQRDWCRYWLGQARTRAGAAALTIRLGRGVLGQTRAALEQALADHPAAWRLLEDPALGPGLLIEWEQLLLDATLAAQRARLHELARRELDDWRRAAAGQGAGRDEQG